MKDDGGVLGVGVAGLRRRALWRAGSSAVVVTLLLVPAAAFCQTAAPEGSFHVAEDPDAATTEGASGDASEEAGPLQSAREAFLEGRRLMGEERWDEAAAAFQGALNAQPTPGLHYHLGFCLEQSGDALGARSAYLGARRLLGEQPAADVAALLPAALERVESRLSRFEVVLVPESAAVWLDGARLQRPYPEWIAPGRHAMRAEAEGYERMDRSFEATAGAPTQLDVTLRGLPAPPPAAREVMSKSQQPVPPPPRSALPRTAFWGSVTFGALGLVAGVAGTVWRVDASGRVAAADAEVDQGGAAGDDACLGPIEDVSDPCQRLRGAVAEEESATILLVGGFVAAGVGAAGALASWAIWPRENFAVRARPGFGSVQLEVRGRF